MEKEILDFDFWPEIQGEIEEANMTKKQVFNVRFLKEVASKGSKRLVMRKLNKTKISQSGVLTLDLLCLKAVALITILAILLEARPECPKDARVEDIVAFLTLSVEADNCKNLDM